MLLIAALSPFATGPYNACKDALPTPASNNAIYVNTCCTEDNIPLTSEPKLTILSRGRHNPIAMVTTWPKIPKIILYKLF